MCLPAERAGVGVGKACTPEGKGKRHGASVVQTGGCSGHRDLP
jgi:hypothetical protein